MGVNVDPSPSQVLEINLFMRFLREVELEDVNLLVRRNTWYHLNGYFIDLWRLLNARDALMIQRSKSKWLKEGDANLKIFHNVSRQDLVGI